MAGMIWFKKGVWARLAGGLAVLWLCIFFFFDPALKFALVKAGQAAAGAKVEISSINSKWLRGTLEIRGVSIADKNAPMKDLVDISRAGFALDVGAALRGKAVVREAALEGLTFGTARATSGALPHPAPPSKLEQAIADKIAPAEGAALGKAAEIKSNAVGQVDATKLAGLKKLDDAKSKAAEIQERWKNKSAETQSIAAESRQIADDLKKLTLAQVPAEQKKIKDLIARVDAQRAQAKSDLAEVQDLLKQADDLRGKDVNGLMAAAGLPTLDSQDVARRLLGAQTASRLATALHWMRWAKEKAAANKAAASSPAAAPAPARRAGVNVEFPRAHAYPQFLLENAKLSGSLPGSTAFAGVLNGVTSNPSLYGKAATLDLSADAPNGIKGKLQGELDQQNDPVGVAVKFEGTGFSLAGTSLGDGEVGGAITSGEAKASGEIRSVGDEWKGEVTVEASGVKLEPKVALSGIAGKAVNDALKSLNSFNVKIGISGKESDLKLAFSSNIGDAVAAALKNALSGQFDAQRKALQAQVDALYNDKLKGVRAQTDGLTSQIMGPLDSRRAGLTSQLQTALKQSLGKNLPDFKKLFH
ncbi:MAG: TIGR03545 family protein [Elusimicrobia bacterium]|nr:TIGR03545 family protein [Elusimicrobiota bacterium]